jgi:response regulator RpfG family c-di-GMP phosphodiesterase
MNDGRRRPRKHLFVINNSPDFLLIARELFAEEGYGVTTSDFSPTVFSRIVMRQPDALIVDVGVGQPEAWEFVERLHTAPETRDIPLLVTSTLPELLDEVQDQERYGTPRVLVKPMNLDALVGAIHDMIGDA